jgi:undecaprenyl-diphosphatase
VLEKILRLHGFFAYALIFFVPALEASVFLGFFFPGEIAVLLGGVLAFQGRISLAGAIGVAIAGAVIGDSIGYEVGKHFGPRLLDGPLKRFVKPDHRQRATAFIRRHGGKAVFLGRFTAALRVLVPGFAGMAGMHYGTFLLWNILGGAAWATGVTLLGYVAGNGYRRVQHTLGRASLILLGVVVFVGLVVLVARWVSRNPERVSAWWQRQRNRPLIRRFGRQIDFVLARLNPGEVFGLRLTAGALAAVALATGFGVVLRDVAARQELIHVDEPILRALMRHTEGGLTATMKAISALGGTLFVSLAAATIAVLLLAQRRWPQAFLVVAAPLGALGLQHLVKVLVHRPRPPVHALVHASGYGFPSGHAAVATAFYGALALLAARSTRRWSLKVTAWTFALVIVGLIGFARMYLRVHYFTDVLGGVALGAAWLAVVISAEGVWRRGVTQRARTSSVEPAS